MDWRTAVQKANPFFYAGEGISISFVVQKFGGSSVRDSKRLLRAAEIIRSAYREGCAVVAVLSAQGDTTDILLKKAGELTEQADPRELDALLSTGEAASVALGAIALQSMGVPAISFTAPQVPIRTDSTYGNAAILRVGTRKIRRALNEGKVVLVTGFQGVDREGNITTLGRGGSDLSAVALAAALRADRCQIYTDVDGVYTTDPRVCPAAKHLDTVPYGQMLALAANGAQVLHDRSVALAAEKGVVLEVLSCEKGSACTRVMAGSIAEGVTGITKKVRGRCATVTAIGHAFPSEEIAQRIRKTIREQGIMLYRSEDGPERFSVSVDAENADRTLCLMHRLLIEK